MAPTSASTRTPPCSSPTRGSRGRRAGRGRERNRGDHRADRRRQSDAPRPQVGRAHPSAAAARPGRHYRADRGQVRPADSAGEVTMAETKEKPEKKDKKAAKPPKGAPEPAAAPAAPAEPAPRARLLDHYEQRVRPRLQQQFGFGNTHQIPKLVKIVLNVGMGDAIKNPKGLEAAVTELAAITGQQPVVTRAKKSIANFNLRQGATIGCSVTLRGARMYEFLDRFISLAVPRMRG